MRLNDLDFHVEIEGHGPPLLLLHGFTGSVRVWDEVRPALAKVATTIAIDLIGHGRSAVPDDAERYSLEWSVRDLLALIDGLGFDSVDLLGYSMGGRVALHFAVEAPDRVHRLILESTSPGIQDEDERQRRVSSDDLLAMRIVRAGIEPFVAGWEAQPLLEPGPRVSAEQRAKQHAQRLANNPIGLANSLRGMGAGRQRPLWSALSKLVTLVHLLVGERDARYRDIAGRMHSVLPSSELTVVSDAGHTVHLDRPDAFVGAVRVALTVELREIEQPDDPYLEQVAEVIASTFSDPNVVLGLDRLRAFLASNATSGERRFCVLAAISSGRVVGLTVFSYVPASNCGFSEYIVVARQARGGGLGRRLFDARKAFLDAAARRSGHQRCRGLFIEVENPDRSPREFQIAERETALDAGERLRIFDHLGFKRLELPYVQPPLGEGKDAVDYLDLLFAPGDAKEQRIAAALVLQTLRPIWAAWAPDACRAHYEALRVRLGDRPVELMPL